jgi:hypothetical protein
MIRVRLLLLGLTLVAVDACDKDSAASSAPMCQAIAQAAPLSTTIRVAEAVTVAFTIDGGCPAPIIRNETPTVVQVDAMSVGLVRVTGLAAGQGRIRVRSGVDTLVTTVVSVSVTP